MDYFSTHLDSEKNNGQERDEMEQVTFYCEKEKRREEGEREK